MDRLKYCIAEKEKWSDLQNRIDFIEKNINTNTNDCLDNAKSILETICKTVLEDRGITCNNDIKLHKLVKDTFENIEVFSKLKTEDIETAKSMVGSIENLSKCIGEFRNNHGSLSHGKDIKNRKFDKYLFDLALSSIDNLSTFIILAHSEDYKNKNRIEYDEEPLFNKYIDDIEECPEVSGIAIIPSKSLYYSDFTAYKDQLIEFTERKEKIISQLEGSPDFVNTRLWAGRADDIQDYFNEEEIKRIANAIIKNPQIYRITGHGYTKRLIKWVHSRNDILDETAREQLVGAYKKKLF